MDDAALEIILTDGEIREAVWSGDGTKSPGYDGFNLNLIKEIWETIGPSICNFIKQFMEQGILLREVNTTWVALTPKEVDARKPESFRTNQYNR